MCFRSGRNFTKREILYYYSQIKFPFAVLLVVTDMPQGCGVTAASTYSNVRNVFMYKEIFIQLIVKWNSEK